MTLGLGYGTVYLGSMKSTAEMWGNSGRLKIALQIFVKSLVQEKYSWSYVTFSGASANRNLRNFYNMFSY